MIPGFDRHALPLRGVERVERQNVGRLPVAAAAGGVALGLDDRLGVGR
jgi:hypothetical protein